MTKAFTNAALYAALCGTAASTTTTTAAFLSHTSNRLGPELRASPVSLASRIVISDGADSGGPPLLASKRRDNREICARRNGGAGRESICALQMGGSDNDDVSGRSGNSDDEGDLNSRNDSSSNNNSSSSSNNKNNKKDVREMSDVEFDRAVRRARAQAEIDRITSGPDAFFDREGALEKLVGGIPPPTLRPGSAEHESEDRTYKIESAMHAASSRQDFTTAAAKREELSKLHLDDCGDVLQVNSKFYRAFSEKDYEAMSDLWLMDSSVLCIHPSHKPLVGSKAVLESWKKMFESTDATFQRNWMDPTNVRLAVRGTTAVVTCDEAVYTRRFQRGKRRQTELVNKLTATNIFRKVDGRWYMVHHHASWHADSDAAKMALNGQQGLSGQSSMTSGGKNGGRTARIFLRGSGDGGGGGKLSELRPDGMLGLGGIPLDDLGKGLSSGGSGSAPIKRVFMGSLSDLLNGGLSDILSDVTDQVGSSSSSDDGKTIIHFSNEIVDDDEDDEDDDDLEDEEDGEDDDEDDEQEAVSIIKQWAKEDSNKSGRASIKSKVLKLSGSKTTNDSGSPGGSSVGVPKDALRQNCISALRKLCNQGAISPNQKRLLLTDIITCSAKGEFSMVEVAYELLCGEGEDKDAAEEEFADQCRVFATSMPDLPAPSS